MTHLDQAYDYITYTLIAGCFLSALYFIATAVIDSYHGWQDVTYLIWNAGLLMMFGIILSVFVYWLKSHVKEGR